MAESKHTRGNLKVEITDGVIPGANCVLLADNYDCIASITLPFPFDTNYDERDANARRLALAWNCHDKLLEALQLIADGFACGAIKSKMMLANVDDEDAETMPLLVVDVVRAAIALATEAR